MDCNLELGIGLESQRKRPFLQNDGKEKEIVEQMDIISDLPDHLIARALSFLETDEAVRTCVLSSRWRYLWKGIGRICLRGFDFDPDIFSNLVEHVLKSCNSANFLAFELFCPLLIDVSRLNSWIASIKSCKIEKLTIHANNTDDYILPESPLPQCILSYNTLVYLNLDCFDIQIPESVVSFPCLKSLNLQVIFPDSEDAVNRLLSCCPVLEKLYLLGFIDYPEGLKINISVSTLRRLSLRLVNTESSYEEEHDIIINTPNLEYLSVDDDSFSKYVVKDVSRVSNVFVNYEAIWLDDLVPKYIHHLLDLLKGIATTELLTLHWSTIDVLGSALSYAWPAFPHLTTLIMQLNLYSGWTCFSKLLHSTPKLAFFILDLEGINDSDNRPSDDDLYQWTPPDKVPNCLLENLEIIGIQCFKGNEDEVQVVEYLLNNSHVLKSMMIGYDPDSASEEVREKLLMFPRASKTCDVEIYERVMYKEQDPTTSHNDIILWGV
ncbi:putative FBD-associated F-box protein At5g53635 [Spinacia oleracea]|uniref:FBD-associated F-box protein At5g53635 n=1 Tax=Spinacia oleracea TaxID=3562 RepID=A0A9R0JIR6_SPIOL|nr:putative FBD-associated F-box protein At5g53635 [Spinacia oleracea]